MRAGWLVIAVALVACDDKTMPPPDLPPPCQEDMAITCAAGCGHRLNSCGLTVGCPCATGEVCQAGVCVQPQGCMPDPMGACLGRQCGVQSDGCDGSVTCGTCASGATCSMAGQCVASDGGTPDAGTSDGGMPSDGGVLTTLRCPVTRVTIDRPDESSLPRVRLMYVIPSDRPDESLDVNGKICNSALKFNAWLQAQTGRRLRLDASNGELDIGFYRLGLTNAQMRGTGNAGDPATGIAYVRERIERELSNAGLLLASDKLYAVFYGGESAYACGGAAYPPALIGQVIAMYLKGIVGGPSCEARPWGQPTGGLGYFDWAMLHDLLHGLGIVPTAAPNHHSSGHAFDVSSSQPELDLMYSPRPGQNDPGWNIDAPAGLVLDLNRDDYFSHGASQVDLSKSAFLEPLPPNAVLPPGW